MNIDDEVKYHEAAEEEATGSCESFVVYLMQKRKITQETSCYNQPLYILRVQTIIIY